MTISLTFILIGLTLLISYQAFNNPDMKYKLAFHPSSVAEFGEWYRFLSSGFVHNRRWFCRPDRQQMPGGRG